VGGQQNTTATVKNCYATGNVTGGTYVGGVVGFHSVSSTPSFDSAENCVALNLNISNGYRIVGGAIFTGGGTSANFINNYGRADIKKNGDPYDWSADGPMADETSWRAIGADITSVNWGSQAWWTGTAKFDPAVWDFSGISATSGPKLKGMPGGLAAQNPIIQ